MLGTLDKYDKAYIFMLGLALLFTTCSFGASLLHPEGNWFSRSGAVMVLLALFVEFRIGTAQQEANSDATFIAGFANLPMSGDLPLAKQIIAKTALWVAIFGTLIWGYGDLLA